jgi:hypothetical protein
MPKTQFSLFLANKRGELASFAALLARANVNLQAISVSDGTHSGVLKVVVDDPAAARAVFENAGLRFHETQVVEVALSDKPGALAELCAKLTEEGYSIDYVYGSACRCAEGPGKECKAQLIISVSDLKAVEALERIAFWPGPG